MTALPERDYDVIIAGGRPAGATLAARLGMQGARVLLLERAALPSPPSASSPIIYASTMALLDEIGAREDEYARATPPLRRMVNLIAGAPPIELRIPMAYGRDYAYGIDRARFDYALWRTALRQPSVEGRQRFSVTDLLWEDGRVTGVVGKQLPAATGKGGVSSAPAEAVSITAHLVIGADGRFSTIARRANALTRDEHTANPTSLLYAYWRGAAPLDDGGPCALAYGEGRGIGYLLMDSADDTLLVAIEGRADLLESGGDAEARYLDLLRSAPPIWARVQHAERVTGIHGMRKVGNLYRQPGGDGWALVGDAYHQKDPLDGQGIYDAVKTAQLLAEAIRRWRAGEMTWDAALAWYDAAARAETLPMYRMTLDRVRNTLYADTPVWLNRLFAGTVSRWIMQDTLVQEQLSAMLLRQADPTTLMGAPVVVGALLRGPLRDLSARLEREIAR
jgi:flavin-dependent dehydrogenase